MKFWLVTRYEKSGSPAMATDDQQMAAALISQGYKAHIPELGVEAIGRRFRIRGSYTTNDRNQAIILMKIGGHLRFNAQDAIDEGLLTFEEMKALGFANVVDREPTKKPEPEPPKVEAPKPEIKPSLPDFYVMKKDALVAWADNQVPQIHLDRRKRKDDLVKDVLAALKERE